jgi:hypoxia up-regulated 1
MIQATRFPLAHFPYVKPLIALPGLPPSNISSIYPSQPRYDADTQTLYFQHDAAPTYALNANDTSGKTNWLPEEILAHELNYIKALASSAAKEPVTDLFLTIPSYFTQHQRRAFKDAAEIAGLNLVGSVGEGAAVGLNYAMTRQFPKLNEAETAWNKNGAQIDVIYDSGAMKTTATVLAFYTADVAEEAKTTISKSGKKSKLRAKSNPTTHVHVLATSSEPTLGGVQIDQALREILVQDVAQKLKISDKEVLADDRAMRKLWKEAARTKAILSANQEASVNVRSSYRLTNTAGSLIPRTQHYETDRELDE